ncbi:MAG: hypothetical protein JEZ11_08395 [Desulfobacterales bacterium]|nr:hypothetical protein [Desulfobacterales bacterium]
MFQHGCRADARVMFLGGLPHIDVSPNKKQDRTSPESVLSSPKQAVSAGDMVNVDGVQISAADFMSVKAQVAGEPAGNRVFAKKAEAVNVGPVELSRSDFENIKAIVAGDASLADAAVYAQAPEMVNVGPASVARADYETVKEMVNGSPVARLAQHIQAAHALN